MSVLVVDNLTKAFGGLYALKNVSFEVKEGELLGIIGPNGSGKTTLFNNIAGVYTPTKGEIIYEGKSIVGLPPNRVAERGIARTFQNVHLFNSLTVLQNVLVGQNLRAQCSLVGAIFRPPSLQERERELREKAMEILRFVGIEDRKDELAKNLSYGEQKKLEIARALALEPRLLLLDEPVAGLNPQEKVEAMDLIEGIRRRNVTLLLIEHDMRVVMGICDRLVVLNHGQKIADGPPEEVRKDELVLEAYLG